MRLLIVEDERKLALLVQEMLEDENHTVDVAFDGEDGLQFATTGEYDVIILDLMLPGLPGLDILRRVRARNTRACVLILTARDTVEDRVKGLDSGADDYLVKPFAFKELLARVRSLVRRKYNVKDPLIRVADLEIETTTRQVRRGGEAVELTAREYALLEFLALRSGEVVSRSDVWEHVYNFEASAESNVVDAYIKHLRRKLERPGLPRLIHTRRGQGYLLGIAEDE